MERRGKEARCRRDRERECARDGALLKTGGSVGCKNGRWRDGPFWDKLGSRWKDYLIAGKLF